MLLVPGAAESRRWEAVAAAVLRRAWGLRASPVAATTGWNHTWRADGLWLTCRPAAEGAAFRRETELFGRLNGCAPVSGVRAPVAVPTSSGGLCAEARGHVWRLTEELPGETPSGFHRADYPRAGEGLARLHGFLAGLGPRTAVQARGPVDLAAAQVARGVPRPADLPDLAAADRARLALGLRAVADGLAGVRAAPRQLLHGDPGLPNLRVDPASRELVAVLDLEAASVGPVEHDLGCIGLSAFSHREDDGIDGVAALASAVAAYRRGTGRTVDERAVYVLMLANEIRLLRELLRGARPGENLHSVVQWQFGRYRKVFDTWSRLRFQGERACLT
ncbi:phosphotransferase family protein [Streptomyces sp. GS7]|uniref:phosphotransferase family protein n=1 Tax=Streptomyces sp. GS7 TaxID=2692234 RepID=UPI001316469E|nr:aminoglycoside phosphotransferase family protein [Streptomyces sp. GS7]QHC21010.1 phosphotransferase [Streptomyces sp. GS7]